MVDFDKEKPLVFNASVVWNRIRLDYHMEAAKLLYLMNELHGFLCSEIDKMNNNIVKDFSGKSKEELMGNGVPNLYLQDLAPKRCPRSIKVEKCSWRNFIDY